MSMQNIADDDVFLQADEMVHLALDGRVGEDLGGLLERGGRQERIRSQGRILMAMKRPALRLF